MRISDWSSDVCSSDLLRVAALLGQQPQAAVVWHPAEVIEGPVDPARIAEPVSGAQRFVGRIEADDPTVLVVDRTQRDRGAIATAVPHRGVDGDRALRSEEHTSELQSLMRTSYAVFCLKKK